jgi:hypothetical protein
MTTLIIVFAINFIRWDWFFKYENKVHKLSKRIEIEVVGPIGNLLNLKGINSHASYNQYTKPYKDIAIAKIISISMGFQNRFRLIFMTNS